MEILIDGRERAHHNMARQRDDSKQEKIKPSHDITCCHNKTSKCSAKNRFDILFESFNINFYLDMIAHNYLSDLTKIICCYLLENSQCRKNK